MHHRAPAVSLVLAFAFACGPAAAQLTPPADPDDLPMPPMAPMGPPAGVKKLSDAGLSCEQIHAEATALEAAIATHQAAADAAQRDANAAQEAMMKRAMGGGSMAAPVASSLLGMVPGVGGMIGGMAAQAAASAQMNSIQESSAQMTVQYQKMAQVHQQLAYAQARNDHLVGLFLSRNCKLPSAK